ncbi:MAG: SH3 domain-containing protein [Cyanobacteria bacterium P01_A01_bin.84]
MDYAAYVSTNHGDSLAVRSSANGEKVDFLTNGSEVRVQGNSVRIGNWNWVKIGAERWVASEFLKVLQGSKIVAIRSSETIAGGLKVYKTQLINKKGEVIDTVRLISGRVNQQTPSHIPNTQTPPPFGIYTFQYPGWVYEGKDLKKEFGGVWSPIIPTFKTQRSEIGIHYDPSTFSKTINVGTAGCFATPTVEEKKKMTNFIRTHKPSHFVFSEK